MNYRYKCPACGDPDHIDITVTVSVRIVQHEDDENIETDADASDCHDHEWGDNSDAVCTACGHLGIISSFENDEEEEDEEEPCNQQPPSTTATST